jgi:hypothetical protein
MYPFHSFILSLKPAYVCHFLILPRWDGAWGREHSDVTC